MISAIVVLVINVVACIMAMSKHEVAGNLAILYDGDCNKAKHLDLWLHLLINILSTMLLGASNYSMQCVSAPTRTDIDKAHRKKLWMDIGVPSIRNLRFISWPRKILWCCLVLSSVPLHLMYNSVVYSSTAMSEAAFFIVTDDFLTGASYNLSDDMLGSKIIDVDPDISNQLVDVNTTITTRLNRLRKSTSLVRLESPDCQKVYGSSPLISGWGDALAVTMTASTNNSLLGMFAGSGRDQLICDVGTCTGSSIKFPMYGLGEDQEYTASYCLAMKAPQHCKVGFTVGLVMGVIACNLVKIICMGYIVLRLDPRPLVTLGDALASFLEIPGQSVCAFPQMVVVHMHEHLHEHLHLVRGYVRPNPDPMVTDNRSHQTQQRLASA